MTNVIRELLLIRNTQDAKLRRIVRGLLKSDINALRLHRAVVRRVDGGGFQMRIRRTA